jgi:hypothetical protein
MCYNTPRSMWENEHVGKFKNRWFGLCRVQNKISNNTIILVTIETFEANSIILNINKLKFYEFYDKDQLVTITSKQSSKEMDDNQKGGNAK